VNVGLVLAGGVAKGSYQVGFLKALSEEKSCNITAISGASIGLSTGYAYSAGKMDFLDALWRSIHFDSTADLAYYSCFKHYFRDLLDALILESDVLRIPIYSPICYLPLLHMRYCKLYGPYDKHWKPFMQGAMGFPGIAGGFHLYRGQIAVDGGLMDNIPLQPIVANEEPDFILVLHFEAGYRPRKIMTESGIPIIDYGISLRNLFRKHSFDFHSDTLRSRIESGYEYGKDICKLLFNDGKNNLEALLAAAEVRRLQELPLRAENRTFETWVQRMNELLYPLVKGRGATVYEIRTKQKSKEKRRAKHADKKMS